MIFLGKQVQNWKEPFIVAEISGNHNGDFNRAIQLIDMAKEVGADAVKLQCYHAEDLTLENDYNIENGTPWEGEKLFDLYKKAQTPMDWIKPLFEHAQAIGLPVFSSVYSERGINVLEEINCQAYKIASYEANDIELVKKVIATGKPVVISLGTIGQEELDRLMLNITGDALDRIIFLHCVGKYPLEFHELGLQDMVYLQQTLTNAHYSVPVGFSCHCADPAALVLAAGLGAAMTEVHLNLGDEGDSKTADFEFSFSPEQLRYGIDRAKQVKDAMSVKNHTLENHAHKFKRSLFLVKDIARGEKFTREHLATYRPNTGEPPYLLPNIIGRVAAKTLLSGTPMRMEYVE